MFLTLLKKIIFISSIAVLLIISLLFVLGQSSRKTAEKKKIPLEKFNIAYFSTAPEVLVALIGAKEGGFLAKHNVDVKLIPTTTLTNSISTGSSDVVIIGSIFPMLRLAASGHDVVWIAALTNNTSNFLVSRVSRDKIKKIGITSLGSPNYYLTLEALKIFGIDSSKITMTPLVDYKGINPALDRGDIDASVRSGPAWENYKYVYPDNKLLTFDLSTDSALLNSVIVIARGELVKSKPDALSNLVAALLEGSVYAKLHPEVIRAVMVKDYGQNSTYVGVGSSIVPDYINVLRDIKILPDLSTVRIAAQLMVKDVPALGSYDIAKFINIDIAKNALTKVDFKTIKTELSK